MKVSKRTVAREWLIFLAFLPLGGMASFFVAYHQNFDAFWNDWFGFKEPWDSPSSTFLWFAPYLCLSLIRSIWWSITTLATPQSNSD